MFPRSHWRNNELGIAYNMAIVDAGGHLVAFARQDGAIIGSIDLAIDKAVTARYFDRPTSALATVAQSGQPLFGIQESNDGKTVIFGGGVPIAVDRKIIGAVGASAGTVEQGTSRSRRLLSPHWLMNRPQSYEPEARGNESESWSRAGVPHYVLYQDRADVASVRSSEQVPALLNRTSPSQRRQPT